MSLIDAVKILKKDHRLMFKNYMIVLDSKNMFFVEQVNGNRHFCVTSAAYGKETLEESFKTCIDTICTPGY